MKKKTTYNRIKFMGGKIEKKVTPVAKKSGASKVASVEKKVATTKKAVQAKSSSSKITEKKAAKISTKNEKSSNNKTESEKFSAWSNAKTVKKSKKEILQEKKAVAKSIKSAEESEKKLEAAKKIDPASQREKKEVQSYGDDKIKHLDALEHIRLRSGMYIGRLGNGSNENDGIYVLMKEVIDNSIDEFIVGFGKTIEVSVADGRVKVRDYGRGIPLSKVVECVSQINTGAKYNDDVFQFSVGMNGVGTKAVNALSSYFRVVSIRDGKCTDAVFEKGKLVSQKSGSLKNAQKNGTYFEFVPDEEIFGKYTFNMEYVESRMWNYAFLNPGLTIKLNGKEFKSDNGLLDLLNKELDSSKDKNADNSELALYDIGSYTGEHLKFAFSHVAGVNEIYFSFVNGQWTSDGGTHLNAFKEGFIKGIREFYGENFDIDDIRFGLRAAVLVKIKDPIFESQTKNKLGNTDIKQWIVAETQSGLDAWLHKNSKAAEIIKDKIKSNERYRTDLSKVKKEAKELDRKTSIRIDKLKDCHYHLQDGKKGENSMIFITEGQSASGTMTHSRNADYQAIFSLRGKPENMYGKRQSEIYKNAELYMLMKALGIEQNIEDLRYSKIVIATDADNDGFHIRNLLLTFFLGYFEELVMQHHIYILETPLFRVRNKKEKVYCYSEEERDAAQKKLGASCETTRFKGLGEISGAEFKDFIQPETIRLTPVEISQLKIIPKLLEFYMGKNTPERRSFIEKNLLTNDQIDA